MDSQATCDRMKQVCVDNGLDIWKWDRAFYYEQDKVCLFHFDYECNEFFVCTPYDSWLSEQILIQVTESEFLQLLKEYKDGIK